MFTGFGNQYWRGPACLCYRADSAYSSADGFQVTVWYFPLSVISNLLVTLQAWPAYYGDRYFSYEARKRYSWAVLPSNQYTESRRSWGEQQLAEAILSSPMVSFMAAVSSFSRSRENADLGWAVSLTPHYLVRPRILMLYGIFPCRERWLARINTGRFARRFCRKVCIHSWVTSIFALRLLFVVFSGYWRNWCCIALQQ